MDTDALIGSRNVELLVAARLRYYRGHWSDWMVMEFSRVRTAMVIHRATRELAITANNENSDLIQGNLEQRLLRSRSRVNAFIDALSRVFIHVDYHKAEAEDLSWLKDINDIPVMRTALAVCVPGVLVTENKRDFPIGETRNGILIISTETFLEHIFQTYPEARDVITRYAAAFRLAQREERLPPR